MDSARQPAVAGRFYVRNEAPLREQVEGMFTHAVGPGSVPTATAGSPEIAGLVAPHAGLPFSGPVAAHSYAALAESGTPETVVILGPNHTGVGAAVAVPGDDEWRTPLGSVQIDADLREQIVDSTDATVDDRAHASEHAAEVQLPFLQYLYDDLAVLPISLRRQDADVSRQLGEALAAHTDEETVVIASSDFTHYEPHDVAIERDELALDRIEANDPAGLIETVEREGLSVCGYGAIAAMLWANGEDSQVDVFAHATSGDTAGSRDDVVGYASVAVRDGASDAA
ncbi:candidate gene for the hypothesized phosphomevalonate decarboxylase; COG1355, predicted dioxygenase [Halorhabdus tiamatea SARL4B]|nr:candidate gene for the hypothesized phosphomevalonate decarboxylase; COG1355, predicted dioxygenase [Halorhabdus tiamatea SARL4B]